MKLRDLVGEIDGVIEGSGNVFADLGLPDADRKQTKARLTLEISRIIRDRGLTQVEAARILGIKQPHVSELIRNRAGSFSVGRLIDFLTALGQNVEITVTPAREEHGAMSIASLRRMSKLFEEIVQGKHRPGSQGTRARDCVPDRS